MRKEFEIAYRKAEEVLENLDYSRDHMIRTASVIDIVEKMLNVDVRFADYDFVKLTPKDSDFDFSTFGAAMCVSHEHGKKSATILINEKESSKMKRFSLVHELGHLITQSTDDFKDFQVSTHIDMDITAIPNEILNEEDTGFLMKEQIANIFALLVLIPFDMLVDAIKRFESFEEVADFFGVEKNAIVSRLMLEDAQKIINE